MPCSRLVLASSRSSLRPAVFGAKAAAQESSDHLPDRDELRPRDAVALVVAELAVRDQGVQKPAPLALSGSPPLSTGACQALVLRPVVIDMLWTQLFEGVLVDALCDVSQVFGTRMRTDEEEGRADCRDPGTVEDVVSALHRQNR